MPELDFHDLDQVGTAERMEDDDLVDAVQELGSEMRLQGMRDCVTRYVGCLSTQPQLTTQVGGHDDQCVAKIHRATLTIRQAAIIQQLQQHIEYIRVSLLDFIEQNHAVRAAAHRFGQLAAFLVADVPRRRSNQTADGVFLLVFAHIDPDHGPFIVKHEFGQGTRQFGLAHTGRAQEDE